MNVFDWLGGLPLSDSARPFPIIEVSFKRGSRKDFYRNTTSSLFVKGDWITVEGSGGYDVGQVSLQGELVKLQMKKHNVADTPELKKVLRLATDEEIEQYHRQKEREQEVMVRSRAMARSMNLEMKIAEVELQADGKKGTFFYTADQRVDFRELIKRYASDFHMKVEMRQIGARQESGKVGGIGSCGRELCCSTWLTDFKSVNTAAARYQNLSINQTKLSGQCGRLKCCLNYELDTYMDALRGFPTEADSIETAQGRATLQKRDIFRSLMWYSYAGSNKQYPLSIERVLEIKALNKDGIKPEELGAAELIDRRGGGGSDAESDQGFVNDVGQISLRALERNAKNRKKKASDSSKRDQSMGTDNLAGRPTRPQKGDNKGQQKGEGGANNQRRDGAKQPQPKPQQSRPQQPKPQQKAQPKPDKPADQQGASGEGNPSTGDNQQQRESRRHRHRGNRPRQSGTDNTPQADS
jgi:cell fate regulator YaaT (PSP1 superfamily)